jgi:sulfopropanediol 3-dehydrogenase
MREELKTGAPQAVGVAEEIRQTVSEILFDIERERERAVRRWSERLDGWNPRSFRVHRPEFEAAEEGIEPELRAHIDFARSQVVNFAELQRATLSEFETETLPGVVLGQKLIPVQAVGSYSPAGRYPMIASSIMTVAVPKTAGVGRVVACAPPGPRGGIHPAQLYAMTSCGADEVICIGGVQGLAALAYGIEDIEPVDMIVGAGNAYVAEAKRQLFGSVGIDLLAGPTEILIIADDSADAGLVAADLLGQAEHGPTSPVALVTTSRELGERVLAAVKRLLETWPTAEVAGQAWAGAGAVILCSSDEEAVSISNELAYEHVEVFTRDPEWYLDRLCNYGSLFLGPHSTVAYGDKAIGTNHVLPTQRAARYTGGLWVGKFIKTVTYQRVSVEGTQHVAPAVVAISDAESMLGHARTAQIRLQANA